MRAVGGIWRGGGGGGGGRESPRGGGGAPPLPPPKSKRARSPKKAPKKTVSKGGEPLCEAEVQDVAVLDDVVLAFEPELAGVLRARFAVERDVVVIGDGLGADEALLEIGVDDAGGLRRLACLADRSRRAPPSGRR